MSLTVNCREKYQLFICIIALHQAREKLITIAMFTVPIAQLFFPDGRDGVREIEWRIILTE